MRADFAAAVDERPPDLLTVEEAGAVLRIGRSKAYELAREFLATNGASGMPVLRLAKQFRVPRVAFEQWIGAPITWPIPKCQPHIPPKVASPVASITSRSNKTRPTVRRSARSEQPSIPFPA